MQSKVVARPKIEGEITTTTAMVPYELALALGAKEDNSRQIFRWNDRRTGVALNALCFVYQVSSENKIPVAILASSGLLGTLRIWSNEEGLGLISGSRKVVVKNPAQLQPEEGVYQGEADLSGAKASAIGSGIRYQPRLISIPAEFRATGYAFDLLYLKAVAGQSSFEAYPVHDDKAPETRPLVLAVARLVYATLGLPPDKI